jgi:hypothetical protein
MNIEWHNEKRKIKDLIPYVANPRQITEKQAQDLKASLERFGIADPLIINTDNTIIGGHQRKKILETLMNTDPDFEIDVRVPDRELSIDEARELNVRLNKNEAEWNFDILANNFELDDLKEWGFESDDLVGYDYQNPKLDEMEEKIIRQKEKFRVLISVPLDYAIEIKSAVEDISDLPGIEIDYGAN